MKLVTRVQILKKAVCISLHTFEKGMNLSLLPLAIIFTNPSTQEGYDTRSIFKWSLTGLNSEYFFSSTSCLTKAEDLQSVLLFTHSWKENNWIHTFPQGY